MPPPRRPASPGSPTPQGSPRPVRAPGGNTPDPAKLDRQRTRLAERISAYPGSITYLDLIRKNKRDSVLLMVGMFILSCVVAGSIAGAVGAYAGSGREAIEFLLPSILLGVAVGVVVFVCGALWSWYGGSSAVLGAVGAQEISKEFDPELFNVVDEVRIAAGLPMPKVYLIPESALNAFATGRDPQHAAVAITTGLRSKLSRDELQGVMAHEMAHVRHYDIRFAMLMATMVGLIVFACDAFLRIVFHGGMRMGGGKRSGKDGGGGAAVIVLLVVALLLSVLAPLAARFIQMAYSRRREYLADAGAVELTRNPEGLASALATLKGDDEPLVDRANRGTAHMFIVNPLRKHRRAHHGRSSLFSSHPPIDERIARLLALTR